MPSWVWNHMRKGLRKDGTPCVKCNYCCEPIKPQKKGNTSNLMTHLKRRHEEKLSLQERQSTNRTQAVNNEVPTRQRTTSSYSDHHSLHEIWPPLDSDGSLQGYVPTTVQEQSEGSGQVPSEDEGVTASQFDAMPAPHLMDFTHGGNHLALADDDETEGSRAHFTKTEVDKYTSLPAGRMFEQFAGPAIPVQDVYQATTSYSMPVNACIPPKMLASATTYSQQEETIKEGQDLLPQDATYTGKPVDELTKNMCDLYDNVIALRSGQCMTTFNEAAVTENANTSSPDDDEDDDLAFDDSEATVPTTVKAFCEEDGGNRMQQPKDDVEKPSPFRHYISHEQLNECDTRTDPKQQRPSGDACWFSAHKHNTQDSNVWMAKDRTALHDCMPQPIPVMACGGQVSSPSIGYGAVGYRPTDQRDISGVKGKNTAKKDKRKKRKQPANEGISVKSMRVNPGVQGVVGSPGSCRTDVRSLPGHSRHSYSPSHEMAMNNLENTRQQSTGGHFSTGLTQAAIPVPSDRSDCVQPANHSWGNTLVGSQFSPNVLMDNLHISPQLNPPLEQGSVQCVDQLAELDPFEVDLLLNGKMN